MKRTIVVIMLVVMGLTMVSACFAEVYYSDKRQATYFGGLYEAGYTPRKYMSDAENRALAVCIAVMQLDETLGIDINLLDLYGDTKDIYVGHPSAGTVLKYADTKVICIKIPMYDGKVCLVQWSSEYNFVSVRISSGYILEESRKVDQETLWAMYDYLFDT